MARIRIAASNPASIPTPPANKATMFLDITDMSFKAKLPDGSLIPISATQEYIQDQFANFIQDSSTINFTYDDNSNLAYLEVIQSALDVFQIPVTPSGNLTSTNVGAALNELQSSIDTTDSNLATEIANRISGDSNLQTQITNHINDPDPHPQYLKEADNLLVNPQIVRVKISNAGAGEFTSLNAAIASITDADPETKPYVVMVGAGVHNVVNPLVIPSGVSIRGEGINVTTLKPTVANQHLLIPGTLTEISFLNLKGISGSIGSGKAAVYCENVGDFAQIHKVSIYDFDIGIENNSNGGDSTIYVEYTDINGDFLHAVKNTSDGINANRLQLENFYTYESGNSSSVHILSSGATAELLINSAGLIGGINNKGIVLSNGGTTKISDTFIQGFLGVNGVGLQNENIGSGSFIEITSVSFSDNTSDLQILNPSSTGTILGALDRNKVSIVNGADFSVSFLNTDESGITFNGKIFYSQNNVQDAEDISELIINTPTMGVINGGIISHVSGLTINISQGYGYRMNGVIPNNVLVRETWNSTNLVIPASSNVFVYMNTSGVFVSNSAFPNTENNILLGRVISDSSSILYISQTPLQAHHYNNKVDKLLREALGPVYVLGSLVSENGTRQLDVTQGEYYYSENEFIPTGAVIATWDAFYKSATPGVFNRIASQNTISNSQYDDGSGTLASIPASRFTKHVLYVLGGPSEKYLLVFGQDTYVTQAEAEAAPLAMPPSFVTGAFVRIASIVVQQGSANISSIVDERPRIGFASPSTVGGVTSHSDLSGLGNDDHTQYLLVSGSRPMSGNLDMGGNSVVNVGTIDGVDVSNHASRHLPNGADPLATGTPSTISDSTNSTGTANALARQDHVHSHGNRGGGTLHAEATTSVSGFMSAADKTKLDGIEPGATADQLASEVPYNNITSGLTATNVQTAIDEIDGRVDSAESSITSLQNNKLNRDGSQAMTGNLNMGGFNITNVGTVDGRDVSVDGTKLDGIEPGATADQLASEVPVIPVGNISSTNVQSAIQELDSEKQPIDGDLTAVANLTGTGFISRTAANNMATRNIVGASGEVSVTNGDGVSGNPTIGLPDVGTAGSVGASNSSLTITTDAKGRITSKVANLISIVSSQVTDFATTVLNTVLNGYSVGSNTAIAAADTILQAFGKVQGQLNALFNRNINTGTGLQGGGNLTADRTLSLTNTGVTASTYGDGLNVPQIAVDAQGRITSAVNVPIVFGQNYQDFTDTVQSTTTSTANPVTAVASSFTTTNVPAGRYKIHMQFFWTHSVNNTDARFALYVDGVLVGTQMNVELADATTNWNTNLLGHVTFGAAGTHTIELRFGSESGVNTCTVNRVDVEFWRVS